tara:strand:+ start:142 stop:432 length:291 start_codon:yes stop_codon:yes gene_type:complete
VKIEDDPLLPQCYRDNPSPDRQAMEWVTEQIRRLPRGQWQRAVNKYDEVYNKGSSKPVHQQINDQRRNANKWLRNLIEIQVEGRSNKAPGLMSKPK